MSAFDRFKYYASSPESPVSHAFAITPDDSADLTHVTRALYVGGGGDLRVVMADGATVTFAALAPGWHPVRVRRPPPIPDPVPVPDPDPIPDPVPNPDPTLDPVPDPDPIPDPTPDPGPALPHCRWPLPRAGIRGFRRSRCRTGAL